MKRIHYLEMLFMVLITFSLASCSDKNEDNDSSGITNQTWSTNQTIVIPEGNELTVSFTASGKWTAKSGADWCQISPASGEAGKNTLKISADGSTLIARTTSVIVKVDGSKTYSIFNVKQDVGGGVSEDLSVNTKVDEYLKKNYLWNEEYKTLKPNFNLAYDEFLSETLMSMTTNTLDKKPYLGNDGKAHYSLFSYILKKNKIASARSTSLVNKEKEYNFGITGVMPVRYSEQNVFLEIQGVYQESSAAKQGLKRGFRIYYINGQKITLSNYSNISYTLVAPSSSLSLPIAGEDNKAITISSAPIYANPVILNKVINKGANRIGYLVYSTFDAGYDEELFNAFKEFKAQGVTDLILDLRYNGGGHVISADLISSCIAGVVCKDKVFVQYRYNSERMKKYTGYDSHKFSYDSYANLSKTSLSPGGLNLNRLYCLVSGNSASASELVINALKGIDIQVILIGETTHGKNVGMEPIDIEDNGDTYEFAPITFQSYNAKGFGAYENGFTPNYILDDADIEGDGLFDGYIDYATDGEPLFSKAISLITGEAPVTLKAKRTSRGMTAIKTLPIFNPRHTGMIKLSERE